MTLELSRSRPVQDQGTREVRGLVKVLDSAMRRHGHRDDELKERYA